MATAALAVAATLGLLAPTAPAAAAPNLVRQGPNLTLVVASCPPPADNAVAEALAAHSRNAAKVCIDPSGLSPETAALIAEFAPDRVLVVGGETAMPAMLVEELAAAARAAYRWTVVERLDGATRVETAAAAARVALERPDVVGLDTVTLIVANGWDAADVRTAADLAELTADTAVAYVSPRTIAEGLPAATAALIADYRPARVMVVGRPSEIGSATETAIESTLTEVGTIVEIERVIEAGEPRFWIPEASPSVRAAREIFTAITQGTHTRDATSDELLPVFAASSARGPLISGRGERLWTVRADGSGGVLRSPEHRGWSWNPGDGTLGWSNLDGRLRAADPDGDERVVIETGGYPTWSPDGRHVVTFRYVEPSRFGRRDRIEAHIAAADGQGLRRIGFVDYRTFLYSELPLAAWSPDGTRFAYVEQTFDPEHGDVTSEARIWSVDAGAPSVALGEDVTFLGWSPDGTRFAYATPSDCDGNGRNESQNLWIADADGSSARDVGFIDRIQWRYLQLWSPDGTHLAYELLDPADCSMHLKVETSSGEPTDLAAVAEGRFVGWSPRSTHLAYGITVGTPGKGVPLREHTWVVRHDGNDRRELGEVRDNAFGALQWSVDNSYFAYTLVLRDARGDEVGLQPAVQRTNGIGRATHLAERGNILGWSPVDDRLAYVAHYDDNGDGEVDRRSLRIRTVTSPAVDVTLVHELTDITLGGRWSPDGAYIGYGSGPAEFLLDWFINRRRGSDAWVVATDQPRWTRRLLTDLAWGAWQPK